MIRSLSVVVPAYNERAGIAATLKRVRAHLATHFPEHELVVVDDGSGDGTSDVARAELGPNGRLVRLPHNRGKGAAVRAGVADARCEWILVVDADLAIPMEQLPALQAHAGEVSIVIGSKRMAQSQVDRPLVRRLGSVLAQLCIKLLAVRGFHDTQCGFKLLRADIAKRLFALQRLDGFGFDFEILCLARKYRIAVREVPVRGDDRGDRSVRLSAYVRTLGEALRVAWCRFARRYPSALP